MVWERSLLRLDQRARLPAAWREVRWQSESLGHRVAFLVHSPPDIERPHAAYPVLYLLHGSGHDRRSLLREIRPQDLVQALGAALLVIPDGDQGWWLDSPLVPRSRYGSYLHELMDFVDSHYPTAPVRGACGLCGFSMGGFGAMLFATQHPDRVGAASSLLGPVDIVQMHPSYHRLRVLLGPEREVWQRHNPTHRAAKLAQTALCFCTAEDAFDRPQNEAFAAALRCLQIPFEYHVHPGEHDTAFVRRYMAQAFAFHRHVFDRGQAG